MATSTIQNNQQYIGFENLGQISNLNIDTTELIAGRRYIATYPVNATNSPNSAQGGTLLIFVQPNGNSWGEQIAIGDGYIFRRKWNFWNTSGYASWQTFIDIPYYTSATLNSNYFSNGYAYYFRYGNMVFARFGDLTLKTAIDDSDYTTELITGLPKPREYDIIFLLQQYNTDQSWRVKIKFSNGALASHYDAQGISSAQWYGFIVYLAE